MREERQKQFQCVIYKSTNVNKIRGNGNVGSHKGDAERAFCFLMVVWWGGFASFGVC